MTLRMVRSCVIVASIVLGGVVHGASPLEAGRALLLQGDFDRAIQALDQARRETHQPARLARIHFLLGLCHHANGDLHAADDAFHQTLRRDPRYQPDPAQISPTIRARFERIRAALRGTLVVLDGGHPPGSSVQLDGRPLRRLPHRETLPPGEHMVQVRDGAGQLLHSRGVSITPDHEVTITVHVERPPAPAPPGLRWSMAAGGLLAIAASPSVTGGFTVEFRPRWRRLSLGLEGRGLLPVSGGADGGRVRAHQLGGALSPCVHLGPASGCAVLTLGVMHVDSDELVHTSPVDALGVGLGGRLAADLELVSVLGLRVFGEILGQLNRATLVSGTPPLELWRQPAVSGVFGLMLTAQIR